MKRQNKLTYIILLAATLGLMLLASCGTNDSSLGLSGDNTTRDAAGSVSGDLPVTTASDDQALPNAAYDSLRNRYFVVWGDRRNDATKGSDIYGAFVNSGGARINPSTGAVVASDGSADVAVTTNVLDQTQPRVAYSKSADHFLVVWTDARTGTGKIYGAFISASSGAVLLSDFPVYNHSSSGSQMSPTVKYNEVTQDFMVAWSDESTADQSFTIPYSPAMKASQCYDATIVPQTIDLGVFDTNVVKFRSLDITNTASTEGTTPFYPLGSKTYSGKSYTLNSSSSSCATTTSNTNVNLGEDFTFQFLITAFLAESAPALDYNRSGGAPILAWAGKQVTYIYDVNIYRSVVVNTTGYYNSTSATYNWTLPQNKNAFTWNQGVDPTPYSEDTYQKIYVGFISGDVFTGTPLSAIDESENCNGNTSYCPWAYYPTMSYDTDNNRLLVVWESQPTAADGGTAQDLWGQLMSVGANLAQYQGQFLITKDAITGEGVQYNQTSPRAAFDPANNRYMVVWEDARNTEVNLSNMDVYGQFVDPQGQLSGGNFMISQDESNQQQPSVAFGDNDVRKFLITWKDGREASSGGSGDANIYGRLWEHSTAPQLLITDESYVQLYNQTLDFGGIDVFTYATKEFYICNNGNATLTIESILQSDTNIINLTSPAEDKYPFNMTTVQPASVNPGTCYRMEVRFGPTTADTYSGSSNYITVTSDGGTSNIFFTGYGIGKNPYISTTSVPNAVRGQLYSYTIEGMDGSTPYTWSISSVVNQSTSAVYNWLNINSSSGLLYSQDPLNPGTSAAAPNASGTYTFTVTLTDYAMETVSKTYTISISALAIATTTLPEASKDTQYTYDYAQADCPDWNSTESVCPVSIVALGDFTGGNKVETWEIVGGSLPTGLFLNSVDATIDTSINNSIVISGKPTALGTFSFTIRATDTRSNVDDQDLSIYVSQRVTITTASLKNASVGSNYNAQVQASGGSGSYAWTTSTLPSWLKFDGATGIFSGTPTTENVGTYSFTVYVEDTGGLTDQETYTISVVASTLSIDNASLTDGTEGEGYTATLSATGGVPPITFAMCKEGDGETVAGLAAADIPADICVNGTVTIAGLTLSSNGESSATLSGTPTSPGTYDFDLIAIDGQDTPFVAYKTLSLTILDVEGQASDTSMQACYIATASYGSYLDPHVQTLREFRDHYLLTNPLGRSFVSLYYRTSPPVARFIARHDTARTVVRWALTPVVYSVAYPLPALGIVIMISLPALIRRRR